MFLPLAAFALAAAPPAPDDARETYVAYAASDGVVEWRADEDRGLFIRSLTGGWYYARTAARCGRLRTALAVGFVTRGSDDLDRFGALVVEGKFCPLASVTRSAPPPGEADR